MQRMSTKKSTRKGARKQPKINNRVAKTRIPVMLNVAKRNSMPVPLNCRYTDLVLNVSSTTTVSQTHLTNSIAVALAAAPQSTTPVYQGGGINWRANVRIYGIECRFRSVGAQSNALIPADLYNLARILIFENSEGSSVVPSTCLSSVDGPLNFLEASAVLYDQRFQLESQAFDSSNYNVPENWQDEYVIPYNRTISFYSAVSAGTSGWQTKDRTLWLNHCSDSAVTPHPTVLAAIRIYFNIVESNI